MLCLPRNGIEEATAAVRTAVIHSIPLNITHDFFKVNMESMVSFKQTSKFVYQLHLCVRKTHHVLRKQAKDEENKVDGDDL